MKELFNFSKIEKSEKKIRETWESFRDCLSNKKFQFDDVDSALGTVFLKVFDDLFSHGHVWLEKELCDVMSTSTEIVRAAYIKDGAPTPNYDRFIPNTKFITSHNRFSPLGVEWLYLAIGTKNEHGTDPSLAKKCALKECRASVGDHYALCCFRPKDDYKNRKVVDLTIAVESNFEEINNVLEQCGEQIRKREVPRGIASCSTTGIMKKPDVEDIKPEIEKWAVYTYALLLSKQIFLPITTEDREIMYSPFQCMAQYFLSKGYAGIVYSSTVFPAGKNLVLFDKQSAEPYNPITNIVVPDNY